MFRSVSAEQYKKIYAEAFNLLKIKHKLSNFDIHELAHKATEILLLNPSLDLTSIVCDIENSCCNIQMKKLNLNKLRHSFCEFSLVENFLDLGRLYLNCMGFLSLDDRKLFLKIWSSQDLTDQETSLIEQLGKKVREVLNATASSKAIFYKIGGKGKNQVLYWNKIIAKISAITKVDTPRD